MTDRQTDRQTEIVRDTRDWKILSQSRRYSRKLSPWEKYTKELTENMASLFSLVVWGEVRRGRGSDKINLESFVD